MTNIEIHSEAVQRGFEIEGGINWNWYSKPYEYCTAEDIEFALRFHAHSDRNNKVSFRIHKYEERSA